MFQAGTETGPETAAGMDFPVVGPAVVIRTDSGSRSYIALAEEQGRCEKGIVMVLFMCGKDQIVQDFTAGYGGIVP